MLLTGELEQDLGLRVIDPTQDRTMICGSIAMLDDLSKLLDFRGV